MRSKSKSPALHSRITLNNVLLSLSITVFILIITFNSGILKQNLFLTAQLIISIPLLLSANLSNITALEEKNIKEWVSYGSIMYIIGYAFLNNAVGILIATQINLALAITFFITNWFLALGHSYNKVRLGSRTWNMRLRKDFLFISLQVLFGLLPILGIIRT